MFFRKFLDAGIQDVSTSISITVKFEEMTDDDDDDDEDESDKHLEARDRRYSCLIYLASNLLHEVVRITF